MQIKLHQLRAFNAVAEQGSIRSASRLLSLSQPAVTKAVKELEESLGTSLVQRGAKGAVLTHCGEAFYQRSRLILRELHLAQEDVRQHLDSTGGSVYIGVAASIAVSLMPEVVANFMKEFPEARIQVSDGQIQRHIQRLRQGEIDFCINTAPLIHRMVILRLKNWSIWNSRWSFGEITPWPRPRSLKSSRIATG